MNKYSQYEQVLAEQNVFMSIFKACSSTAGSISDCLVQSDHGCGTQNMVVSSPLIFCR
jgi:hypothetical protein